MFWWGLLWFTVVPVAWSAASVPNSEGFFFNLIISSLLSVLWGQPWASQSPNTLQCMLGIRSRTVLFESVLAACSGLFCGWETLHLVLCSESFIGASLWRMSKSYQNSQHRISDANWSLSVSTDQKGQSEGYKVTFAGRSQDAPDNCKDDLARRAVPRTACAAGSGRVRKLAEAIFLWVFIRKVSHSWRRLSCTLKWLLFVSVYRQWLLATPKQTKPWKVTSYPKYPGNEIWNEPRTGDF